MAEIKKLNSKMKNLKLQKGKQAKANGNNSAPPEEEDDDPVAREIQFKAELLWCKDHIREELLKAKTDRQKETLVKAYNVLLNTKASMVHKRQVMSQYCGDYRKKMAQEIAKSSSQLPSVKVLNIATATKDCPATGELRGTFLKTRHAAKRSDTLADKESTSDFKLDFLTADE